MAELFTIYELGVHLQEELVVASAEQARTKATNYLRRELGVDFTEQARTLVERVPAGATYRQLVGPLVSVESVTVDGRDLVRGAAWEMTRRGISCPEGFGAGSASWVDLEVAYTAGFAEVPDDLHDAGLYLAGLAYPPAPKRGVRASAITVEGVSETESYTDEASTAAVALDEHTLRSLRAAYGSGRPLAGSVRLR
jgi:hypothetical protein